MSLRGALLSFRIQRFETTVVVGAAILSVLVSLLVIWIFNASGYARCQNDDEVAYSALCQASLFPWLNRIARLSVGIVPVFPVVAGLLAGGPIVARELENGTARLAWSLGPSRLRWFAQRALPILLMVAVAALAIGWIAGSLTHLIAPSIDLDRSFAGFRARGLLVGVEAILVASIALAFGAILGRSVPTLVLSLILVGAIGLAVDKVERQMLTNEAEVADSNSYTSYESDLYIDSKLKLPDGTIATWEEAAAIHPEIQNGFDETSGITYVVLYIPGSRYHDVEAREALTLLVLAGGFAALAAVVVLRRRPR
jgi:hypothetical protein